MSFNLLFCQKCAETSICRLNLLVFHFGRHMWHWSSGISIQVSLVGLTNPSILDTCITTKQGMSQNLSLGNYLIPLSQNMMCCVPTSSITLSLTLLDKTDIALETFWLQKKFQKTNSFKWKLHSDSYFTLSYFGIPFLKTSLISMCFSFSFSVMISSWYKMYHE